MTLSPAATALVAELQRVNALDSVLSLLQWDEQAIMPPQSAGQRAAQLAALTELAHREHTGERLGAALAAAEAAGQPAGAEEAALLRETRKHYDRLRAIPAELAARRARLDSEAFHAWVAARRARDFAAFAPYLEQQLALAREEAACLGFADGAAAYDYAIDKHDPGMTAARIAPLFAELQAGLVPLVGEILGAGRAVPEDLFKGFDPAAQEAFLREVVAALGFDFQRGRLDRSVHPFCSGNGADTRMTTRYDPDQPLDSLFSSIHEAGHGMYEQGVRLEYLGTALGEAVGMAWHESQSRLWENQVARSRAFWRHWEPRYRAAFPQLAGVDSETLYRAVNAVGRTPIRVDADEVTYNLHIILRFRLERALFDGSLPVRELPALWNELSREVLGLTPEHDGVGCLQDIHWSGGAFGYFPSYCLGNMIAAQLWYRVSADLPGLEDDFAAGQYGRLLGWLRDKVHRRGKVLETPALVVDVTGAELSPQPLLRYLRERYLPLYR